MNLLGIINRGSSKLALNTLARELVWLCLSHKIVMLVELIPREINVFAGDISKWLIPNDYYIHRPYFITLDCKLGPHTCDLSSTGENTPCCKFYSFHWCRGTSGVNGCSFDWSLDNSWIHAPFRLIRKIWRTLGEQGA